MSTASPLPLPFSPNERSELAKLEQEALHDLAKQEASLLIDGPPINRPIEIAAGIAFVAIIAQAIFREQLGPLQWVLSVTILTLVAITLPHTVRSAVRTTQFVRDLLALRAQHGLGPEARVILARAPRVPRALWPAFARGARRVSRAHFYGGAFPQALIVRWPRGSVDVLTPQGAIAIDLLDDLRAKEGTIADRLRPQH